MKAQSDPEKATPRAAQNSRLAELMRARPSRPLQEVREVTAKPLENKEAPKRPGTPTSFLLEKDLVRRFKICAAQEGRPMGRILEELIETYLSQADGGN
jgi:hypothetical protein